MIAILTILRHKSKEGFNKHVKQTQKCRDPGSNRGPLDLQSNALPTELSRHDKGVLIC